MESNKSVITLPITWVIGLFIGGFLLGCHYGANRISDQKNRQKTEIKRLAEDEELKTGNERL